jgi:hypothetical protein
VIPAEIVIAEFVVARVDESPLIVFPLTLNVVIDEDPPVIPRTAPPVPEEVSVEMVFELQF